MKLFIRYFNTKRKPILVFSLFFLCYWSVFYLYHLPVMAVIYPTALCIFCGLMILVVDFWKIWMIHRELLLLGKLKAEELNGLPEATSILEEDYQKIIEQLKEECKTLESLDSQKYDDMVDYYTLWVHQIKTPIAAMRLHLQNEDSELSRKLQQELNRIENYVEMVLTFLRLNSDSTDYVIKEYDLDSMVRISVKKFASDFIGKKLSLQYDCLDSRVITDEKWLCFVLEQILSNAVKYTFTGCVSIYMEESNILCVEDTGIGINAEDLPRVFEHGYTGFNGRQDKRASGIGLYLCKRICDQLGHKLMIFSTPGEGTIVKIQFTCDKNVRFE